MRKFKNSALFTALFLLAGMRTGYAQSKATAENPPATAKAAPPFTLPDVSGKMHTLAEFRKRPVVLFFFCGCNPCHETAKLWAQGQQNAKQDAQGHVLPEAQTPRTIVVFTGDAESARVFAAETGLPADTVLLTDPEMKVTNAYHAEPCPRALVLDADGVVRYSSLSDAAKDIVPITLVSRVVGAAQSAAPTQSVSGLSVTMTAGMERTGPDAVKCDLGTVNPARTPHCERDFMLKNKTDAPLVIARVRGSCGCESVTLRRGKQEMPSATLAPGEQITLHVSIKMQGQRGEHLHKFVWVDGANNAPLTTLALELAVHESVSFSTGFLAFATIPKGTARSLEFSVTAEKEVLNGSSLPPLVSSNPALRVETVGPLTATIWNGRPGVVQNYKVSPADASQLGSLESVLHFDLPAAFVGPSAGGASKNPSDVNVSDALRNAALSVSGDIIGSILAMPRTLLFGNVEAGKESRRSVLLAGLTPDALQAMTVSSDNKWVTARIQIVRETAASQSCFLEVILNEKTPPGIVQAKITLTSKQGEKELVLPVVAERMGAK